MAYSPSKIQYVLLLSLLAWLTMKPSHCFHAVSYRRNDNSIGEGRILWNMVGDYIESSPYFPITVNVPDVITSMGNMMSSIYDFFFGGGDSSEDAEEVEETSQPSEPADVQQQTRFRPRSRSIFRHQRVV